MSGYWLDDSHVNHLVLTSLEKIIAMAKWSHMTDVELRNNGEWKRFQADWIKYLERREAPPV